MNLEDVPADHVKKNGTSSVISYVLVQVQKDNTNQTGSRNSRMYYNAQPGLQNLRVLNKSDKKTPYKRKEAA